MTTDTDAPTDDADDAPTTAAVTTDADADAETLARLEAAAELLEQVLDDRGLLAAAPVELRRRLLTAAGRVSVPDHGDLRRLRKEEARRRKKAQREADTALLDRTGIRAARAAPVFATPSRDAPVQLEAPAPAEPDGEELRKPRSCYICKKPFTKLHRFYDSMCGPCGDDNWQRRTQTADLTGRVALVTGSRVKIGFQAAIKLLRAGCRVLVTTRFPRDAATRYAAEDDFGQWSDRLEVHGLDLRHTPSVEAFCRHLLGRLDRLDFILNNACQTVRRPSGFYGHLMDAERAPIASLAAPIAQLVRSGAPESTGASQHYGAGSVPALTATPGGSAELSQVPLLPEDLDSSVHLFPDGSLDADLQQVDLRTTNSWRLLADEVPAVELLEVQLVNAVAPFVINARLKPLMVKVPTADKHIVNVSAVEGQFYRTFKTPAHPHTNMAKAALNMLTRTVAPDYVRDGIHVNSVDTGWVTDEDPLHHAMRKRQEHGFHPPLDIVDGAARICAPIFEGLRTGEHVWGRFLKDYRPVDW